tara:strand:- start:430 stop:1119 length:690 start_codon:yes stop_codon:yes gene_type:complete
MGLFHSPKIITDGLRFAVDAANVKSYPGSGTTFFDLSANGHNSTEFLNMTSTNWTGESFDFNGTDEEIKFNQVSTNTNSFSVECWANWDVVGNGKVPFGCGGFFRFYYSNSAYLTFWVREAGGGASTTISEPVSNISAGQWYQLVGTCQGGSGGYMKVYSNGTFRNSKSITFNVETGVGITQNMRLGNAFNNANSKFDGKVAIARFYDKVLTDEEIKQNFDALRGRFEL